MIKKQPLTTKKSFDFSVQELQKIKTIIAQYPKNKQQSAVMPLLDMAQRKCDNWLPKEAIEKVADIINMPAIKVWEIASFYSMYNLHPTGKNHIQICRTTPCWLKGSDKITESCIKHTKTNIGETSADGIFSISEVECLGACVNAPVVQINDEYHEDLDEKKIRTIIEKLKTNNNKD